MIGEQISKNLQMTFGHIIYNIYNWMIILMLDFK